MAIEAQGLEIQIGARTLLHPTNFHVAKGDKIGLVGRNGAGKTTLTRVCSRLRSPKNRCRFPYGCNSCAAACGGVRQTRVR